jgi:hypothetical protein
MLNQLETLESPDHYPNLVPFLTHFKSLCTVAGLAGQNIV